MTSPARAEEAERDRQIVRVQNWLGTANTFARHEDTTKQRFHGTGEWLLRDHPFKNWFCPDQCVDPLLWLQGIPDAGESPTKSL